MTDILAQENAEASPITRCESNRADSLEWSGVCGLGVCASCRLLPRPTAAVGLFYLGTGTVVLATCHGERALAPWAMGLPFAAGQLATAGILYWHLERTDGRGG